MGPGEGGQPTSQVLQNSWRFTILFKVNGQILGRIPAKRLMCEMISVSLQVISNHSSQDLLSLRYVCQVPLTHRCINLGKNSFYPWGNLRLRKVKVPASRDPVKCNRAYICLSVFKGGFRLSCYPDPTHRRGFKKKRSVVLQHNGEKTTKWIHNVHGVQFSFLIMEKLLKKGLSFSVRKKAHYDGWTNLMCSLNVTHSPSPNTLLWFPTVLGMTLAALTTACKTRHHPAPICSTASPWLRHAEPCRSTSSWSGRTSSQEGHNVPSPLHRSFCPPFFTWLQASLSFTKVFLGLKM